MDKWMKNNNFNKILALALGIILWTIVHVDTEPISQTTVSTTSKIIENVKIELTGLDEEKYVMDPLSVDSVQMEVRGKKSDLNFKFSDAYRVMLDLSNVQPGENTLPLSYSLPSGVTLESMNPQDITVHIELRNSKSFPIELITKGAPAEGYLLGTPVIEPATAEVTLAASELGKVAKVQGVMELDGENETVKEKKLKLYAYDSDGNEIKDAVISPATASVELPITLPYKTLPLDIGFTGQLPGSLVLARVTPEQDTVTVYGTDAALAGVSSYQATLDLSQFDAAGTQQTKLELKPPDGLSKIDPGTINVTVSIAEIGQRTIDNIPIKLEGVASGLHAAITDAAGSTVSLTVSGAPTLLDQLDQDSISVIADAGGLTAGIHQLPLQISLPRFISLQNPGQRQTVTVELRSPDATTTPEATDAASGAVTPEPSVDGVFNPGGGAELPGNSGATAPPATDGAGPSSDAAGTDGNGGGA